MTESDHVQQSMTGYLPVFTDILAVDCAFDFDLYLFDGRQMVLYWTAQAPLTAQARGNLLERHQNRLYVPASQRRQYQQYVRAHISHILVDDSVDDFTKSSLVYDSAKELVRDVFNDPAKGEHIRESQAFVESTVQYVLEGRNAFHNMLRIMSFDYTVYTHSVNVCTFALALAHAAGIQQTGKLIELATGALLHDVGKAKVPESILHKSEPLDQSEWQAIRQHPQWGVELMSETDLIPEASYFPIAQHHERRSGRGYPNGLANGEIHIYGRIVAIADAFDAMTTNRVYKAADNTFSTLRTMMDQEDGFDQPLLRQFVNLMGPVRPDIA